MNEAEKSKHYFNKGVQNMLDAESLGKSGKTAKSFELIENAIKFFDQAIEIEPTQAIFLSAKGYALKKLGATIEAGDYFEKSIEMDPAFTESYYQLSLCLFEHNIINSGADTFEEALALTNDKQELKYRLHSDLLELIQRNIFYRDEIARMGHKEHHAEFTTKIIDLVLFSLKLDPSDVRLNEILRNLKKSETIH